MSGVENNSVLNLHIPGCGGGKGLKHDLLFAIKLKLFVSTDFLSCIYYCPASTLAWSWRIWAEYRY